MRYIEELWIIDPYGITLFNYSKRVNEDAALIGGFFSGIYKFIKEIRNEEIESIILEKSKFVIYQSPKGFLFISQSRKLIEDKEIIKRLKLVETKFFELFEEKLTTWDGNVNHFYNFNENIKKVFSSTC